MRLEFYCSMCGKENAVTFETKGTDGKIDFAKAIKPTGWITQNNGENFDIYCSLRCTE